MTRLIIQIPCYNEEQTLALALAELPREVSGVDAVEWLIIDDGSVDGTVEVARANGVDHVVSMGRNQGLAKAFMAGLSACIERGADIIVNTDADNQYNAGDIPELVRPILEGRAEIVVGARPISETAHFSPLKKALQHIGSWAVRVASNTDVADAPSGFRAISRAAAMRLNVFNEYTYTLETIIQAGQKNMAIVSVPVRTNEDLRPSRLVKSIRSYVQRSLFTIVRIFMTYRPMRFFGIPAGISFALGFLLGFRFLIHYLTGNGSGHIQSVILAALLLGAGLFLAVIALVADLIAVNRMLLEDIRTRLLAIQFEKTGEP